MTTQTRTDTVRELADRFISFLETGQVPPDLFAPDMFTDLTLPQWRVQAGTAEAAVALRGSGHPTPGRVPRSRLDRTDRGFVLEIEEEWEDGGQQWYCRELFRADVADGVISELSIYCTGDWDEARVAEHRAAVTLLRL